MTSKEIRSEQRKSKFLAEWKASGLCNAQASFHWEVKDVTVAQKTWLAQKLTSNVIRANELSDLLEVKRQFQLCEMLEYQLNVDVLRKWKKLMKQGQTPQKEVGRPSVVEKGILKDVANTMTRTTKGHLCDTVDGFKMKLNRAAVETQKKRKGVDIRPDVSPSSQMRYAKRLKLKFTTAAETSTTARLREEGGIRNFIVEAAICEAYQKNLPPAVVCNHDASQYGMGKVDWNLRLID